MQNILVFGYRKRSDQLQNKKITVEINAEPTVPNNKFKQILKVPIRERKYVVMTDHNAKQPEILFKQAQVQKFNRRP